MTNYEILVTAFRRLSRHQLATLGWHAENRTPICCGKNAMLFADGRGGG